MPADVIIETDDGSFAAYAVVGAEDASDWPDVEFNAEVTVEPLHDLADGALVVSVEGSEAQQVEQAVLELGRPATQDEIDK